MRSDTTIPRLARRARLLLPSLPDLSRRDGELEVMERADLPREDLDEALVELRRMNRLFGGVRMSAHAVGEEMSRAQSSQGPFTMLDVGCGDGEIGRQVARLAASRGHAFSSLGVDLTEASIDLARRLTPPGWPLRFERVDLFDMDESQRFDVVHTSLVMHHLSEREGALALKKMLRLARRCVIINDLHRSSIAWLGAWLGSRLVTRSHVVHADAPHSVRRAFVREELEALAERSGASRHALRWEFPFRWLMRLEP